jgi:hypothetical protein
LRIHVQILCTIFRLEFKSPEQLRKAKPHVPLGEVNPRTHAPPTAVAIVVAIIWVGRLREFGRQGGDAGVVGWVEDGGVGELGRVVVQAPSVDEDYGVLRNQVAVDPVV